MKKLGAVLLGTFVALLLLEAGLRIAGDILIAEQRKSAKEGVDFDDPNQYRILCLGESTTAEAGFGETAGAWPSKLETLLNINESGPRQYKVINEGVAGTVTAFIVARLEEQIAEYRPHMVISMMGINDRRSTIKYERNTSSRVKLFFADLRVTKFFSVFFNAAAHGFAKEEEPPPPMQRFVSAPDTINELTRKIYAGDTQSAQAIVDQLLQEFPSQKEDIYAVYARILSRAPIMAKPKHHLFRMRVFKKVLAMDQPPTDFSGQIYGALSFHYYKTKRWDKYFDAVRKAIQYLQKDHERLYYINAYLFTAKQQNRNDPYVDYLKEKYKLTESQGPRYDITRHHYRQLYAILKAHHIKYAAMQYPTRDIRLLKYFFSNGREPTVETPAGIYFSHKPDSKYDDVLKNDPNIIFISNEPSFASALSSLPYDRIFIDRFGGTFGHTTAYGHQLIAKTAANALITSGFLYRDTAPKEAE